MHFLTPFNFFASTNIRGVSFFIDTGKRSPRGIIVYATFLYFLKMLITVSSCISNWIGFKPPATSKFCCALIIADSIGSDLIPFFLFQVLLLRNGELFITSFYFWTSICFSWNVKFVLRVFFFKLSFLKLSFWQLFFL